jgi:hypothetical protein
VDGRRYPELSRALAYSSGSYHTLYKRLVEEAVARGELAAGVDPRDVTDMFGIINFGLTMLTVELPGDRHRVAIRTIEKLLSGDLFPENALEPAAASVSGTPVNTHDTTALG